MKAKKKPIEQLNVKDLGLISSNLGLSNLKVEEPPKRKGGVKGFKC